MKDFKRTGLTLWRRGDQYYRLHGYGITPNRCWIIHPTMRGLKDIDAATGEDIFTGEIVDLGEGVSPACFEFIKD